VQEAFWKFTPRESSLISPPMWSIRSKFHEFFSFSLFSEDIWITVLYISAILACSTGFTTSFEADSPPIEDRLRLLDFFGNV